MESVVTTKRENMILNSHWIDSLITPESIHMLYAHVSRYKRFVYMKRSYDNPYVLEHNKKKILFFFIFNVV